MNNIQVSIIVPCYKVEKYLDRCILSLVNQTFNGFEIILVDDGSPDQVPKICDIWAEKDNRIKVIHKKNAGLGFARNSGLEIATGEYIAFVDSDDFLELDIIEKIYNQCTLNDLDVCYYDFCRFYPDGHRKPSFEPKSELLFYTPEQINTLRLIMVGSTPDKELPHFGMSVWRALYKRSLFVDNNITFPSERIAASEDLLFHLDFLKLFCE